MEIRSSIAALICTIAVCSGASGQNLYKCGAAFQDKPCDTEVQKKYSSLTGSFSKEQVNPTADAQCADRGVRALPFIQARTRQETLESLHAGIDAKPIARLEKIKEKDLASAVFAKKGSPVEIRAAIETECMDNKQATRGRAPSAYAAYPIYPAYPESNARQIAAERRAESAAARAAAAAERASRRY
ncbi:hypothetical protein [Polaromonas sp. YR568]|uniref:hypothetical protein n=1 Tax=Polaromonas sp. YR568 TaxID=1855301 RepID=UPI00398BE17D